MPTYEYQCAKGHSFEAFQRISDKPKAKCPTCGAKATRVISGGAGLIFKGSGFYITDYGKDGKGPRKDTTSESSPSKSSTAESTPKADTPAPAPAKASGKKSAKAAE
ncbi:MAG: zinc ribbon domain-containing protein [Gemmatimonadetes bacterium]|nr:zinc ribbon domain-containing protein [Gemmatimonadota bacterium]MCC7133402.1 zinc ribbon domain-containing protein [Gemmatimonadales bacterium]